MQIIERENTGVMLSQETGIHPLVGLLYSNIRRTGGEIKFVRETTKIEKTLREGRTPLI